MSKYKEIKLDNLKKYSVNVRESKVNIEEFAKAKDISIQDFLNCVPDILKGKDIKEIIEKSYQAWKKGKPIILGIGGHVIKTGMAPLIIDMMRLGVIKGIACNGSVTIHDFEIACFGQTSEDVGKALEDGSFGMARETCDGINEIIRSGAEQDLGYGEAIGKYLSENEIPNKELSILANAYELNVPVTVHVAIGTDIVHQHETAYGEAIGKCSMKDFRIFCELITNMGDGGVLLNFGSAVIIPEVFLKALTVVRNLGYPVYNFYTAVFDMNIHYRPATNIVNRPNQSGGKGFYFVGHHEIMIPLFLLGLRERIMKDKKGNT